jgi:hypothetical protein
VPFFKDCGVGGKGQRLQDALGNILIASGGRPWDAAMFSQRDENFETVSYYFSPSAPGIARVLIEDHGAVPCSAPARENLALAIGDARALEMLWPSPSRGS